MEKHEIARMKKLESLAGEDEAYRVWQGSFLAYAAAFQRYADSQPEAIREILWGYAESGRLMNQRLVNLACENMEFPENGPTA